jgi:hypothetical protein
LKEDFYTLIKEGDQSSESGRLRLGGSLEFRMKRPS